MISAYILEFDQLTPEQRALVDHWIGGEPPPRPVRAAPDFDIETEQREGWAYQNHEEHPR